MEKNILYVFLITFGGLIINCILAWRPYDICKIIEVFINENLNYLLFGWSMFVIGIISLGSIATTILFYISSIYLAMYFLKLYEYQLDSRHEMKKYALKEYYQNHSDHTKHLDYMILEKEKNYELIKKESAYIFLIVVMQTLALPFSRKYLLNKGENTLSIIFNTFLNKEKPTFSLIFNATLKKEDSILIIISNAIHQHFIKLLFVILSVLVIIISLKFIIGKKNYAPNEEKRLKEIEKIYIEYLEKRDNEKK